MRTVYWISMKVEEGWSPWREVSYSKYMWALDQPDYATKVTEMN